MKRHHFRRALRSFYARQPFQPFTVELLSGSRVVIRHPEVFTQTDETILFRNPEGVQHVFDYSTIAQFIDGVHPE